MLSAVGIFVICAGLAAADYPCVCNYNVEKSVLDKANPNATPLGYMYEFDCKPQSGEPEHGNYLSIMFETKIGYVLKDEQVETQTCPGNIDPADLVTTTTKAVHHTTTTRVTSTTPKPTTTTTTTPKPTTTTTTTTTPRPTTTTTTTTTPKPTTTTTTTTTPKPTTTTTTTTTPRPTSTTTFKPPSQSTQSYVIPEGHLDLCPPKVKHDLNIFNGFLGQFGEYCYEFVNVTTQWHNADRHCKVADNGELIDIINKEEQNFFIRFLTRNRVADPIWLGLTDSEREGATAEGKWTWISGKNVSYTNFGPDYNGHSGHTHKLDDCVIMKPGGEWTDVPCGVALLLGTGFGEQHKFICQYNVTSKPADLYSFFPHAIFG